MKLSLHKILNQKGVLSLHVLVPVILAVAAVGGIGAYVITNSKAASALTSSTCYLRGRVWSSTTNTCTKTCISGAGSIVVSSPYDYCSGALSKISYATCDTNGRKWLDVGCARRWQQTNLVNAPQCKSTGTVYQIQNTYDKCVLSSTLSSTMLGSCTISNVSSRVKKGTTINPLVSVKNLGTKAFSLSGDVYANYGLASWQGSLTLPLIAAGGTGTKSFSLSMPNTPNVTSGDVQSKIIFDAPLSGSSVYCTKSFVIYD